jgi:hypothetical protein
MRGAGSEGRKDGAGNRRKFVATEGARSDGGPQGEPHRPFGGEHGAA